MPRPLVFLILALPLVGAYAMYAVGIVTIYQASRVLNLAHGAMATLPAYLTYTLVRHGVPVPVAFVLGIASGALLGLAVERAFVRRLRGVSPTAQTVGTVAAFGIIIALIAKVWGTAGLTAPSLFPEGHISVGASQLRYGQIGLFVVALVMTALIAALLNRTWFGLGMRSAAANRRAAALMGIDPDLTTSSAWALGGALAALAGILLAAVTTLQPYTLSLSVLPAFVAALIGGLESQRGALVGSVIVGAVIGFVPVLADFPPLRPVIGQLGGAELTLAITAMVVMAVRGSRLVAGDVRGDSTGANAGSRKAPRARTSAPAKRGPIVWLGVVLAAGWVWIPGVPPSIIGNANFALQYAIVAVSLVVLTGWVGQISLAQAAFVGVGAYSTTFVVLHAHLPFPFTIVVAAIVSGAIAALLGMVALRVRGLYLAVATLIFAWMADFYLFSAPWLTGSGGSISIKTKPLGAKGGFPFFDFGDRKTFYLIALAAAALAIFAASNLRASRTGRAFFAIRGSEVAAASLGINVTRYKLLAFAISGAMAGIAGNLIATHQQTISPTQFAFTFSLFYLSVAVVGGLQSLGGAVGASVIFAAIEELFFRVEALGGWLDVVSAGLLAAVLLFYPTGVAGMGGWFVSLRDTLAERWSGDGSKPVVRAFIGGLTREVHGIRAEILGAWREWRTPPSRRRTVAAALDAVHGEPDVGPGLIARFGAEIRGNAREVAEAWASVKGRFSGGRSSFVAAVPQIQGRSPFLPRLSGSGSETIPDCLASLEVVAGAGVLRVPPVSGGAEPRPAAREERRLMLEVAEVTVRFGGLVAVDAASLSLREGEIVGLIGPNGAGKTTLFNAIAGFVTPRSGRVFHEGRDVTELAVHERAARGIGRTFQTIQLSPDLTVFENLLVATHVRNHSPVVSSLVVTGRSARAEAAARERVRKVVHLLDLDDALDRPVADLPFGVLRMIELGRALVTGSTVIMLDEPASGLDNAETDRFAALLRYIRSTLGVSLLLIEHDVKLVMSLCDYVHVLDRGRLIAEGPPRDVQNNEEVVAAYFGEAVEPASVAR